MLLNFSVMPESPAPELRHNWTRPEVAEIFHLPLMELLYRAHSVHRQFHRTGQVQKCQLLSIKTGGCPEDCAYCPQSGHYKTGVAAEPLLQPDHVLETARAARANGATRFCMGAAWRQAPQGRDFQRVLEMVRGVAELGMEVCCTLGMLTAAQAAELKQAGLTAYNHNLDTSPEFYSRIISTRVYQERLQTLEHVRAAGIQVCCGGILGMGESDQDRIGLLHRLATLRPHPESVPINMLVRAPGTPLGGQVTNHKSSITSSASITNAESGSELAISDSRFANQVTNHKSSITSPGSDSLPVDPLTMVRAIAAARILMPESRVRLAAGRLQLSREATALCFFAGANSIFVGEKLLTTPNPEPNEDELLLQDLGLETMA